MKTIYDMQPDTKMVATGSASPVLIKGSQESGAGRWLAIQVPTLSFYEYCELMNVDRPDLPDNLRITPLVYKTQQERTQIMLQLSKALHHFNRYLQVGGFPELALADNDILAQQIMREDVVDKVLKRALPSLYKIRNATFIRRKPPYGFHHTAADGLFAEQVAVRPGAGHRQNQHIILDAVNEQPIREDVTFPMAHPIACLLYTS